jgi:hypothetical protein
MVLYNQTARGRHPATRPALAQSRQVSGPAKQSQHQGDRKNEQEEKEQDFRDFGCSGGYSGKAEDGGNHGNDEEDGGVSPFSWQW